MLPAFFQGDRMRRRLVAWAVGSLLAGVVGAAEIDPDLLAGLKARSIGPAGMSGRVPAIDAVERDPDTVFVGAASGGVWKSTDGGLAWKPVFDDQPVTAIGAIAINQANPSIVWVGTGEGNVRNSASVGNGIYKSVDGGETWTRMGLEATERIHRIVLHPTDPNVAWVAALGREWGENPERGVFKTTDGGKSWQKVLYVDEKTGAADVAIDPRNPNKLFASLWQYRRWPYFFKSGGPGSGLYVSHDGGASWKKLQPEDGLPAGELGRIGLGVSRSNPDVVYALVEAAKSALLRSDDGGKSWKTVNQQPRVNPRPFYFGEIRVDPQDPNRLYSLDFNLRVSTDGGKTLRPAIRGDEIHGDYHAMWIDPANPQHFWVGNDGGIAVTHDGGKSNRFVANLPLAQFYHVAYDMDVPYNLYGGLQDNSSWRGPSSVWRQGGIRNHEWQLIGTGDGFDVRPDPRDSSTGYSLWQGGSLQRWNLKNGELKDIKPSPPDGVRLRFNWNAGFAIDLFDSDTIYVGSQFVHKSTDRGETWTIASPDLTSNNPAWQVRETGGLTPDQSGAESYTTLLSIAPSPLEKGLIWAGTDDGRLALTRDGGASWTHVEGNVKGVPADTWIPKVKASPHAAGTAFVVFDDHRRSNLTPYVYRTDDYGKTWKSLATANLYGYALTIEQDPVDPDLLFLGTEWGLWVSFDGGKRWLPFRHGLPTASVMDLAIQPRESDLIVATHGRALYVIDDIRPLRHLAADVLRKPLHLFATAPAAQFRRAGEVAGFGLGAGEFRGQSRAYGALLSYVLTGDDLPLPDARKERERLEALRRQPPQPAAAKPAAAKAEDKGITPPPAAAETTEKADTTAKKDDKPKVKIEIRDERGTVVRTLRVPAERGLNRTAWNLGSEAGKPVPRDEPEESPQDNPSGPEVPPGRYEVTVELRGQTAKGTVEVMPDPRSANKPDDWQARWTAVVAAGRLHDTAVTAVERIRATRKDLDAVAERVRAAKADAIRRGDVQPDDLPLVKEVRRIEDGLKALERKLWQSPESVGIVGDQDVLSQIETTQQNLDSSWDRPSPNHLTLLRQAREKLAVFLGELERFYDGEVEGLRKKLAEQPVVLLPHYEPLKLE